KEVEKQLKEWIKEVPLKRLGKPEEIAHAVIFLVENEFVNGIILSVDGGESTI
ncbi:MAG: SDR family oxidoreductase, partial [Nanoarchaeota archaeon]